MAKASEQVLIVACMKNEGPFLLEWIAYYQAMGVAKFIIATNDCTDGTDLMLDRLDEMGIVRHIPNPIMLGKLDMSIQNAALRYAALQKEFRDAEWIFIADTDEFLNIQVGDGSFDGM